MQSILFMHLSRATSGLGYDDTRARREMMVKIVGSCIASHVKQEGRDIHAFIDLLLRMYTVKLSLNDT